MTGMRLALLLLAAFFSQKTVADPIPEYEMKATFLYNFALLTEWPAFNSETFNLCILGQDNFGQALKKIEGKNVHGRPISVARLSSLSAIRKCQLLFISEREASNMQRIVTELADASVLTVADSPMSPPSAIILSLDGQRLVFDVYVQRAKNAYLNISSKLLKLARNTPKE